MVLADELISLGRVDSDDKLYKEEVRTVAGDMDKACLLLCIPPLDYTLQGGHFENVLLSFLDVLGIDKKFRPLVCIPKPILKFFFAFILEGPPNYRNSSPSCHTWGGS